MPTENGVESEIRKVLERRAAAITAKNVDQMMASVAEDIVSYDVGTPLRQRGAEVVRERLLAWFAGYDGPIGYDLEELEVRGDAKLAFSFSLVHVTGRVKTGDEVSMWVRSTIGWERRDGVWLAVHEHMSDPMDFESGRARTDLTPDEAAS